MTTERDWGSPEAAQAAEAFLRRLARSLRGASAAERQERLREAEAHLRDFASAHGGPPETAVAAGVAAFGPLPEPARPAPAGGALLSLIRTIVILFIGASGVLAAMTLHLAVSDLFAPDEVGLWVYASGDWSLSYEAQPDAREVLGAWFAPVFGLGAIAVAIALVFLYRIAASPGGALERALTRL